MSRLLPLSLVFALGLLAGGYLFSRSLPRSFLAVGSCGTTCLKPSDLAGLLVSAGIQRTPLLVPIVELESEYCVAIRHPRPLAKVHYVLFPKRDIKNIASLTSEDGPYVLGCFALVKQLAERAQVQTYRLFTNGPALQDVTYLHFHFIAR